MIQEESERPFYGSEHSDDDEDDDEEGQKEEFKKPYIMDSDHRLLLRSVKPLLQSRNASVSKDQFQLAFLLLFLAVMPID